MKVTEGLGLTTSNGKITRGDLGFVRVQRSTFAEALGFTTSGGKMTGEGAVMFSRSFICGHLGKVVRHKKVYPGNIHTTIRYAINNCKPGWYTDLTKEHSP